MSSECSRRKNNQGDGYGIVVVRRDEGMRIAKVARGSKAMDVCRISSVVYGNVYNWMRL